MADEITHSSPSCANCPALRVSKTDPLDVLRRLPQELFNLSPPENEGFLGSEWEEEVLADSAIFGEIPPEGVTPQYELARIHAEEKDRFRLTWARARALQHGLGKMTVVDGKVVGQCPRAAGGDLDRLGEQFGVGRPPGFTDCCYWRLVVLMRFTPGIGREKLLEVAELFSGIRPVAIEEPARITLRWPAPAPAAPGGPRPGQQFWSDKGFISSPRVGRPGGLFWSSGTGAAIDRTKRYWFWKSGLTSSAGQFFWSSSGGPGVPSLRDVLDEVKPAGVALELENVPRLGAIGCSGATKRGAPAGVEGFWR